MASRRNTLISSAAALAIAGGYGMYLVTAQTVPPELAQAPMNITNVIPPAFIMAVDDSGSMTFHNQFPAAEGNAWWNESATSFFSSAGTFRTSGNSSYPYSYTGPRINNYYGIPPIDAFGFARSPSFNPAYFDPEVIYLPWAESDGDDFPQANTTATRIHPGNATAIALASNLERADGDSQFFVSRGMTLPAGTRFRRAATCTNAGAGFPTNNNWTTLTSSYTVPTNAYTGGTGVRGCRVYIRYWPATFYLRETVTNTAPTITATGYGGITPTRITNACGTGCHLWRYTITTAHTAALQNFANWFSFYGNRNRAMIAGMTRSMNEVNNMRVGYFTINGTYSDVAMRDMDVQSEKDALYTSMLALTASGGTPNLPAVNHMGSQFQRTGDGAPIVNACQKNGGMLFTDGFSNVASTAPAVSGLGQPFDSTPANSMAAIASQYYFNDSNGDSPLVDLGANAGKVPVPDACASLAVTSTEWKRLDCQTNQHMNFYGVTLGGRGDIFNPDLDQDAYVLNPAWPGYSSGTRSTVDDIWHATVNTRGDFISAKTPADIITAMRRILSAVNEGTSPSGTIGVTGSRIGEGSLTVQPSYESANNGTDWYGTLTAEEVSADAITGQTTFDQAWEASAKLEAQASRTIRFGRMSGTTVPAVSDFTGGNVTLADLCAGPLSGCTSAEVQALVSGGLTPARAVNYLRGSRTDEGVLRTRTSVLGDIINSPPTLSSPTDDYGYKALPGTLGTSYATYLTSKQVLNRPLVFVGANDGMFHVIDGRAASPGGDEVFAYIPATSLGNMGNLLFPYVAADQNDQKFQHRYYVDGPITVSDVNIGGTWKTIAVGTTGAGGRSVFALDITNPAAITVLWEVNNLITGNTAVSDNIGHVLGKPVIVPVKANAAAAPSWKVIFGNGYNSTNQQARLFVVDAATGGVTTIAATESTAPAYNGLGNVVVVDRKRFDSISGNAISGRDRFADTVYAADQQGAVWKFDLLGTPSLALSAPLYIARDAGGNRQTITGALTAAAGPAGGVMVYFGTGSFSFSGDPDDTSQQTIYGILDRNVSLTGRGQLLQQTVGGDTANYRSTSANAMVAGAQGWYLDLPAGERFVGNPRIESGIVFFPAYEPSGTGSADCSVNGNNWLYGLNALSGGAALSYVRFGSPTGAKATDGTGAVALNTGGSAPVKDVAVMTTPRVGPLGAGATAAEIAAANNATCSMVVRVAGAPEMYLPRPCGRQSWRQVR